MAVVRINTSQHRRRRTAHAIVALTALLAALLVLASCGDSTPSSASLLKSAATTFNATKSFHFILKVDHPGAGSVDQYVVTDAKGDVARPDKLSATATVDAGIATVNVRVIVVGSQEWYTDPITGSYTPTDEFSSFQRIFDPQIGLGSLLQNLNNPSQPQDSSANGSSCWKITGTVARSDLMPILGDSVPNDIQHAAFCIGKSDNRLVSVTLPGQILPGDTAQTVHTFYLSSFDQPVTITPPPGA